MIPELVSYIVRREGKKFRRLTPDVDLDLIAADRMGVPRDAISLYVHIPFCRSLCPFCCFNRYLFEEGAARRYFEDLRRELDFYRDRGFNFSSVYFGGGTPTILIDELGEFIGHLRDVLPVKEISLETTPRELTDETIRKLREAGVNRLSVGVQSFEEPVLKTMGRINGPADEVKKRLLAAQGKFETVNVDFVFNFPAQTVEQFQSDVRVFKDLGMDQATFYPLMASPHKRDAMERKFNRVDNSRERTFYQVILDELYHGGYTASTAWCYSKGDRMIDEYIIEYDDYIGIGAGSVSIVGDHFYVNSFALDRYHDFVQNDRLPVISWRTLSGSEAMRYYLLTKLFGMSLSREDFKKRFGADISRKMPLELAFLKTTGIVTGDAILRVTEKGMYPVSVMMRDFFAALNTLREYCIEHQV